LPPALPPVEVLKRLDLPTEPKQPKFHSGSRGSVQTLPTPVFGHEMLHY
jgi:hypothetical protein